MKVIMSHPTGNQVSRAAAKGLAEVDLLSEFHTAIASFPGSILDKIGGIRQFSEIRRRRFEPALFSYTRTVPCVEVCRLLASKAGMKNFIRHESGSFCVDAVYRNQDKRVSSRLRSAAKNGVNAVYAYEDGAVFSFREAKKSGMHCLYDLPIGYWRTARRLLNAEKDRWPDWASTITGFKDSTEKLARKDEELSLADQIFVASRFTANSLSEFPGALAPIEVIPLGFPAPISKRNYHATYAGRKLKLLFVGGLSQRKGIADLFAVAEKLKKYVSLTVVGRKANDTCGALDAALPKHRWIPSLSHQDILKIMREHDVLVFPSLFEGFGLVITEAMSQGTPVITTDRTAGPDLIVHEENGWLIEAGSTCRLHGAVEEILMKPEKISGIGRAAIETARRRPWDVYGRELAEAILKHQTVMG